MNWTFTIVLWDDSGNVLLERYTRTVKRVSRFVAKRYVEREFLSPYFVELESSSK
jgi:hypothetical protein